MKKVFMSAFALSSLALSTFALASCGGSKEAEVKDLDGNSYKIAATEDSEAVSKALGVSWDEAHDLLADMSKSMGTIMNDNDVISAVLRMNGFHKEGFPWTCRDCYTVREFARDNPYGTYVVGTGSHVVTIIDGNYYDSWRSGDESVIYFWTK